MTQSGWLAAALLAGFVLWLAMQGRLQAYWSLLIGGGAAPATPPPTAATGGVTGPPVIPFIPGFVFPF